MTHILCLLFLSPLPMIALAAAAAGNHPANPPTTTGDRPTDLAAPVNAAAATDSAGADPARATTPGLGSAPQVGPAVVATATGEQGAGDAHREPSGRTDEPSLSDLWLELSSFIFEEFSRKNLSHILSPSPTINNADIFIGASGGDGGRANGRGAGDDISGSIDEASAADVIFGQQQTSLSATDPARANPNRMSGPPGAPEAGGAAQSSLGVDSSSPRPYFGDFFFAFHSTYWPIHCITCLVICTLGIFANVTNIIVLTRPNMMTAVNTILSAIALFDLIVNISNIPYLLHEFSDSSNIATFYSYYWALYILFHAHATVTAHTISIWLTCVLATWRCFVVCYSSRASTRNLTGMSLAKKAILMVTLLVPIICIPNYLTFAINSEKTEINLTVYRVGFSELAEQSSLLKVFHFSIFSCLTKLLPCVLLTVFTTILIRKLYSARERRLRLAAYGAASAKDGDSAKVPVANGRSQLICHLDSSETNVELAANRLMGSGSNEQCDNKIPTLGFSDSSASSKSIATPPEMEITAKQNAQRATLSGSSCAVTEAEMLPTSCTGSTSDVHPSKQTPRIFSQLIVESSAGAANGATVVTTTAPTKMFAACDEQIRLDAGCLSPNTSEEPTKRCNSTCGALNLYDANSGRLGELKARVASTSDLAAVNRARKSLAGNLGSSVAIGPDDSRAACVGKRLSEATLAARGRSVGSSSLAPFQMFKLQAAQRQISQNETTTRLLIAVMIVFLCCEFPAGIIAALCAVLGQDFFDNVYQPTGIVTDLLALLNSSVNFVLYCLMSTQFRVTFYQVVLHCPAPNLPLGGH